MIEKIVCVKDGRGGRGEKRKAGMGEDKELQERIKEGSRRWRKTKGKRQALKKGSNETERNVNVVNEKKRKKKKIREEVKNKNQKEWREGDREKYSMTN